MTPEPNSITTTEPVPTYRLVVGDLKGHLHLISVPLTFGQGPLDPNRAQATHPTKVTLRPTPQTVYYPPIDTNQNGRLEQAHQQQPEPLKPSAIQVLARGSLHSTTPIGVACRRDGRIDVFGLPAPDTSRSDLILSLRSPTFKINQTRWLAAGVARDAVYAMASDGQLWRMRFTTGDLSLQDCTSITLASPSHPLMAATFTWDVTHVAFGGQDTPLTIVYLETAFSSPEPGSQDTTMTTSSSPSIHPPSPDSEGARAGRKRGRANGRGGNHAWPGQVYQAKRLPPDTLRIERKPNLTSIAFLPPRPTTEQEQEAPEVNPKTHLLPGTLVLTGTRNGLMRLYDPNPLQITNAEEDDSDENNPPSAKKLKMATKPNPTEPSVWLHHLAEFGLVGGGGSKLDAPEFTRALPAFHGGVPGSEGGAQAQAQAQASHASTESVLNQSAKAHTWGGAGKVTRAAIRSIYVPSEHSGLVYVSDAETGMYLVDWAAGRVVSRVKAPMGTVTSMLCLPVPPMPASHRADSDSTQAGTMDRLVSVSQDKLVRLHHVPLPQATEHKTRNVLAVPPGRVVAHAFVPTATPWCAIWDGELPLLADPTAGPDGLDAMETVGQS